MVENEKKVPWYEQKKFKTEKLAALQGMMPERRATRIVNRYLRSDAGQQEEAAFVKAEIEKQNASRDAYLANIRQQIWNKYPAKPTTPAAEVPVQQTAQERPQLQSKAPSAAVSKVGGSDYDANALRAGFKSREEVKQWQAANGLVADGLFGAKSQAKWKALNPPLMSRAAGNTTPATTTLPYGTIEVPVTSVRGGVTKDTPAEYYTDDSGNRYSYIDNKLTKLTEDQTSNWTHKGAIKDMDAFKQAAGAHSKHIDFGGIKWINPYFTPGFDLDTFAKQAGLTEKRVYDGNTYYRYDPDGLGDYLVSATGGIHNNQWGDGLGSRVEPVYSGPGDAGLKYLSIALRNAKAGKDVSRLGRLAKGGRINYFQNGGAAPQQQDVKAQVVALVQAAMQGDEKANQQVEQIMEAAKAGNQQAVQLAQLITAVAKQLQGQATSAKWGAKLDYIHTLKCGGKTRKKKQHGGKFCPSCK